MEENKLQWSLPSPTLSDALRRLLSTNLSWSPGPMVLETDNDQDKVRRRTKARTRTKLRPGNDKNKDKGTKGDKERYDKTSQDTKCKRRGEKGRCCGVLCCLWQFCDCDILCGVFRLFCVYVVSSCVRACLAAPLSFLFALCLLVIKRFDQMKIWSLIHVCLSVCLPCSLFDLERISMWWWLVSVHWRKLDKENKKTKK